MKTLVINDLHLGVQRTGGTTLASAKALRQYAHDKHGELLRRAPLLGCRRVVVNGDLTDVYDISLSEALEVYATTDHFMSANPDIEVVWALGNHDLSKDSSRLGTVAFIGALLAMKYPRFSLVTSARPLGAGTYVIPHVANQDLFDLELSRVPQGTAFLLLHCNYDNTFACDADHSLNLSRTQAKDLKARGVQIIIGHEHQGRESLGGSVYITGNQFPTSVSDCLPHGDGQKNGTKRALVIDHDAGSLESVPCWTPDDTDGWFARIDWRDLRDTEEEGRGFIRVEGDASAAEAADAVKAIAAFRQRSNSFVVTNAVKVEQSSDLSAVAASIEDIRAVSVIDMLMEALDPAQRVAVKKLYEEEQSNA